MKRAKQPPPPELVGECQVFADMLALDRRDEITSCPSLGLTNYISGRLLSDPDRILGELTLRAMSEYLRRFPKARKPNDTPWLVEPTTVTQTRESRAEERTPSSGWPKGGSYVSLSYQSMTVTVSTGEVDYQCFFCRKSLYTRPQNKRLKRDGPIHRRLLEHTEICAVNLLAGLMKPHAPLPKGSPGL